MAINGARDPHLPALDGWRGVAISMLLVGHFLPVPGINFGSVGVSFFFVLSGMLMARLLYVQEVPIATFYRRRISRILPAHLSFMVLMVIASISFGLPINLTEIFSATLFINNYLVGHEMPFGHIWSLAVEEHSYILLSVIAICSRVWSFPPLLIVLAWASICALMGVIYRSNYEGQLLYQYLLHTEVAGYGIAISAFICVMFQRKGLPSTHFVIVPLLILFGIVLQWWSVPGTLSQVVGIGSLAMAVNLLPKASNYVQKIFANPILRRLGLWSFSLYLWQQPFYVAYWNKTISLPAAFLATATMGLISYFLIEGPARRYLNARWAGSRKSPMHVTS